MHAGRALELRTPLTRMVLLTFFSLMDRIHQTCAEMRASVRIPPCWFSGRALPSAPQVALKVQLPTGLGSWLPRPNN